MKTYPEVKTADHLYVGPSCPEMTTERIFVATIIHECYAWPTSCAQQSSGKSRVFDETQEGQQPCHREIFYCIDDICSLPSEQIPVGNTICPVLFLDLGNHQNTGRKYNSIRARRSRTALILHKNCNHL